ncbi:related to geranylgeranyl transferase alpha chain [Cephalotrichum gorgonifer]|uniref:Geranylgeranyl transferase type-2 subunit alpha n=1 Tax=Cephalotrichum gorgonifer TaxID=2041049 RepID=A0AAE8N389_9PEZI|nr:related to geranylgeranyl transferase alpha chain [Cephalotrichum gorgonifer]
MTSHGIARSTHVRTEEQRQADLVRIGKYHDLEGQLRERVRNGTLDTQTLDLTSRLLRANPEYYTVWNVRRRCLTSSTLSASRRGSSRSSAPSNSTDTPTATSSSGASSSAPAATRGSPESPRTGPSGITVDGAAGPATSHGAGGESEAAGEKSREEREAARDEEEAAWRSDADVIAAELSFTIPLLMEAPKCYWIWNHRTWALQQATERLPQAAARATWERELGLAGKMLSKDRRNFHAWGYRRWVVSRLEGPALGGGSMAEAEFAYTTGMIHGDLSNFSAWHTRSQLIPRLLAERGASDAARKKFLEDELALLSNAVNVGPEDQSLWYYHQFLLLNLVSRDEKESMVPRLETAERTAYIQAEIEGIKDLLEDYQDIKWIYEALMECALSLAKVEDREVNDEEKGEMREWLGKLRELDPMREGRWVDVARRYGLE